MAVTAGEARGPGMNVDDSLHYGEEGTEVLGCCVSELMRTKSLWRRAEQLLFKVLKVLSSLGRGHTCVADNVITWERVPEASGRLELGVVQNEGMRCCTK